MKIDWNLFAFTQIVGLAITIGFYVFDPKHEWEPRVLAMAIQMMFGIFFSVRRA